MQKKNNLLALDVGARRVGVALAADGLAMARSLPTLLNDDTLFPALKAMVDTHDITAFVVGLPRNMQGEETAQTVTVREFVKELEAQFGLPVHYQDEALTSVQAETVLAHTPHTKADIDSMAAQTILNDYLGIHGL
jgi:putative holliday junction resolvase